MHGKCAVKHQRREASGETNSLARFAANLAHEIRNPLSNIQLNASLLERELVDHPSGQQIARRISAGIRKMDNLVSGLLAYVATPRPEFRVVDLQKVIQESLEFVSFWIEEGKIELTIKCPKDPIMIEGDSEQLQQVFLNLILNAVQAIDEANACHNGGKRAIAIRVTEKPRSVLVTLADTGCGIEADLCEEVFKPFITTKANGTGLGLSIVRSILRRHRAVIRCRSRMGKGTTFEIRFNKQSGGGVCA